MGMSADFIRSNKKKTGSAYQVGKCCPLSLLDFLIQILFEIPDLL